MTNHFIVWADKLGSDAYQVEALSYEHDKPPAEGDPVEVFEATRPPISAGDFVIIEDRGQGRRWFGQSIQPQLNLPLLGISRDNPSQIAVLERVQREEVEASVFLRQVYYYKIALLGEVIDEQLQSLRQRPRVASLGRRATAEEALRYMRLPPISPAPQCNTIGQFHSLPIPITVDPKRIFYHLLIAGSTGSGKSNTIGNIIRVAQESGMAVIVFDHKPDYQDMDKPNDESDLFLPFAEMGLEPLGLDKIDYFAPYKKRDEPVRPDEKPIAIAAMHVDPEMLAAALFYRPGEELQRETFAQMVASFAERKSGWTLKGKFQERLARQLQLMNEGQVQSGEVAQIEDDLFDGGVQPHRKVLQAILRKIHSRKPEWMDAEVVLSYKRTGLLASSRAQAEFFKPEQYLKPGRVMVIRIPDSSGGREYGLFLSYMLNKVYTLRRSGAIEFPVCIVIDEAQDIFSGSYAVRQSAEGTINSVLRKGRSLQIGFVISVQSAGQVPGSILNNLNSRIIHLQQEEGELKSALPGTPKELARTVLSFGPGEALVKMFGARATVHAYMAPSPFLLTKESFE